MKNARAHTHTHTHKHVAKGRYSGFIPRLWLLPPLTPNVRRGVPSNVSHFQRKISHFLQENLFHLHFGVICVQRFLQMTSLVLPCQKSRQSKVPKTFYTGLRKPQVEVIYFGALARNTNRPQMRSDFENGNFRSHNIWKNGRFFVSVFQRVYLLFLETGNENQPVFKVLFVPSWP